MVDIPDRKIGEAPELPPLPNYAQARDALRIALPSLLPSSRLSVVDAAEENMRVNSAGRWTAFDRAVTPYMVEPANMLTSRMYREWIFAGPARTGKTMVLQQAAAHTITSDPCVMHITHMTQGTAQAWVEEELEPMIRNSPALAERQGLGKSDRNIFSKRFRGGTKLTIGWPVVAQLSGRTIQKVLFTDYDRLPLDIGGEGSAFSLGSARTVTLGSRGMTAAESSPGFPVKDPDWKPDSARPHMAPPCDGILALYNEGTRARWYWDCPSCGSAFEPRFERLHYDKSLEPAAAGATAEMGCPHCGGLIQASHKAELNRAGYWLHETADGALVRIDDPAVRKTDRLSYWLDGAAAAFASWARLVSKYETALRTYEVLGDETALQTTVNTDHGHPYLARALSGADDLSLQDVKDRQKEMAQAVAPNWARFITVTADVQAGRFVVMVTAWGALGERAVIDRFDLHTPPPGAPRAEERGLDPSRYLEDWDALLPLLDTVYPVQGSDYGLRAKAVAVDSHGAPGVTERAYKFWRKRRRDGDANRWFLVRGHGGLRMSDRVWYKSPEYASKGRKAANVKLLNIATDKLKDAVAASLGREDSGADSLHIPAWMAADHVAEFVAERRTPKGWEPKPGQKRNESLDLAVYALALAIHFGIERIDYDRPPAWARLDVGNENAVANASAQVPEKPKRPAAKKSRRIKYLE